MTAMIPLSVSAQTSTQSKVVRVGWFDSSYNRKDSAGRRSGYSYEYQRKIAAYTGWTYEYVEASWPELMTMLENGDIDILSDVSYKEERAEKMLFSSYPMGTEAYYLYITERQLNDFNEDFSYFNGKTIGVNKGSVQAGLFREWAEHRGIKAELTELTKSEPDSVDMLVKGELAAYITLDNYLSVETLIPVAKIGSSDIYFAVNKSRPDLLNDLDNALSRIQDENPFYSLELYNEHIQDTGANLFLTSKEKGWLSGHSAIRVGYLDNYLAYCDKDEKSGELNGALKDYLEKASDCFANGHIDFEASAYSTVSDAMNAMSSGEIDCVFPANFSDYDAENTGFVLTPAITRSALYTVVRSSVQKDFTDKDQVTVAVVSGDTNFESIMKDLYPNWKTVSCSDVEDCLKAVSDSRADCFLISSYRYNSIRRLCEKYRLTSFDTGKDIPFCFAVNTGDTELYSILAKTTNIIPDSYVNNALTHYFSEQGKTTLLDIIRDNIFIVIAVIAVMAAMLMLIIVQRRLINAEKKAKENRRIADDLSRRVYVDALTSVQNKGGYTDYIGMLQERVERSEVTEFAVCMFDCDNLKYINDKFGHEKGDEYLKTAARLICRIFQHSPVFRVGGDEFISVLHDDDYLNRAALLEQFDAESKSINETAENDWQHINVSVGMAEYDPKADSSVEDTAKRADERMYENKRQRKAGRNVR
ncbi:MAG: transporter substrate-binding domain-containing protein [Clostridia bacterium]|nr:transporter substrate-binding domain-containing protein [Clostridia bacterium]